MTDSDKTITRPPGSEPVVSSAEVAASELVRILDRYLADLRAGDTPDRQRLLADNPALAEQLAGCLDGIEFIHRAAAPSPGGPAELGEFRIVREIGRGGMGVVYEAEQTSLRRRVALKVLLFGRVADAEALPRFQREAETVARLHHTNIVPIFAVGCAGGVHYYAMQFIEGRSLADVLAGARGDAGPPAPELVARWGLQAAEALEHAHRRGVIHRDVKPSNLLLDAEGVVWLTDFGLARRADEVTLTIAGALLGTPRYMSPESAQSLTLPVDHRTDVYSLGATLYELATGRPVFDAPTFQGVLTQIAHSVPVPPRRFRPRFPRDLETILLACLAKEPARRYETAQALADDLRAFLDHHPIRARRPNALRRTLLWARKHRRSAAVAAITAFLIVPLTIAALLGVNALRERRAESLACRLSLDTDGPPLKAEVLDSGNALVVPTFTVPTQQPVRVPAGAYRVRFSAPGRWSETFLADAAASSFLLAKVVLDDRQPWEPIALGGDHAEVIELAGHADLLIVGQQGLRRLDGATGKEVWRVKVDAPEWHVIAGGRGLPRPPLLRPAPDLDGDGTGDLVWRSAPSTRALDSRCWVLALSGRTGSPLWTFETKREPRPERFEWMTAVGDPVVLDADRDGSPDLLATFASQRFKRDPVHHHETLWVEAISGRTGKPLWSRTLAERDREGPTWHDHVPFAHAAKALRIGERSAVAVAADNVLAVLDPMSGAPVWPIREVERSWYAPGTNPFTRNSDGVWQRTARAWPIQSLWCLDDREPIALALDRQTERAPSGRDATRNTLIAVRFRDGKTLWETTFAGSRTEWASPTITADWPVVEDLDGDGEPEVIVPDNHLDVNEFPSTLGVRVIRRDGVPRWTRTVERSDPHANPTGARMIVGPDLDGDRVRELFLSWSRHAKSSPTNDLVVAALSGRDGRPLWTWSWPFPIGSPFEPSISPMQWCRDVAANPAPLLINALRRAGPPVQDAFLLDPRTGRLDHLMTESGRPQVADLDGDGISDLVDVEDLNRVRAWRLRGEDAWRRLGPAAPLADLNGDGFADFVSPDGSTLVSGRDGLAFLTLEMGEVLRSYSSAINQIGTADLDGDGKADLIASAAHTSYPALSAVSGRTGTLLWKTDLGWPRDAFVKTHARLVRDLDGDGRPEIILAVTIETTGRSESQHWLIVVAGRDGRAKWRRELSPLRSDVGTGKPTSFRPGVGDLDGDGLPDLAVWTPARPEDPELIAFRGRDGARLWTRTMKPGPPREGGTPLALQTTHAEIADLDGDGRPEVASVCWYRPPGPARVLVFGNEGTLRGSWEGRGRMFDSANDRPDAPILIDLVGGRRGVGVVVDSGNPGLTTETSFVVLDSVAGPRQRRPVALGPYGCPPTRHLAVDLDGDGRDEQLLVGGDRLRATRDGLETVVWERRLDDLGAVPNSVVEVLGTQPGESAPLIVVWTGRALLYLDGARGHTLWRAEGPTIPGTLTARPGFVSVAPAVGAPRGLFSISDARNALGIFTTCRTARRVEDRGTP